MKNWKEIPSGGVITEAGNASSYKTGGWRTFRPIRNAEKCINCLICWNFCPEAAINVKDGKLTGFDYDLCKGCGICAKECPVKCIEMKNEKEFRD